MKKYGTEDCTDKLLERYIDGGKHDNNNMIKWIFASALANTIKLDNIDLNKFTNAVNNFLSDYDPISLNNLMLLTITYISNSSINLGIGLFYDTKNA